MKLDNFEYGDYIIIHPDNLELVKQALNKKRGNEQSYIFTHSPEIRTVDTMEPYKRVGWKRTSVMPDTRFYCLVDNLNTPQSWTIFFGLVEPIMEINILIIKGKSVRFLDNIKKISNNAQKY